MSTRLDFNTAFHPQTDGQSKRTIQTLEDMLRMCVMHLEGSWDDHLPLVEFAYNTLQEIAVLATEKSIAKTEKSVTKRLSDRFLSVAKTLVAKI